MSVHILLASECMSVNHGVINHTELGFNALAAQLCVSSSTADSKFTGWGQR